MTAASIRVLVADDHVAIRKGVRAALEDAGCVVCAEAATAIDAIEAAREHHPDICLIDLSMPGGGIRAVSEIVANVEDTSVVVLTVSADARDLIEALRAGAVGYLLKDMDPARLAVALEAVAAGEVAISRRLTPRLMDEIQRSEHGRRVTSVDGRSVELTPREWEVLDLLAEELSTAEISVRLGLDQVTVRRHVSGMIRKLGASTRAEAVRLLNGRH